MFISVYYFFVLFENKIILKKNIYNIIIGLSILVFYIGLAFTNSVILDKYLLRDIRPFITLFYAFILTSLINKEILVKYSKSVSESYPKTIGTFTDCNFDKAIKFEFLSK